MYLEVFLEDFRGEILLKVVSENLDSLLVHATESKEAQCVDKTKKASYFVVGTLSDYSFQFLVRRSSRCS